mgnify:FL=1|tara:strand:+ start:647 stop:1291 length:645 start_codon:yes stop_codon:yes gene_type:complete
MKIISLIGIGAVIGFVIRQLVNWLSIEEYRIQRGNLLLEAINIISVVWSFQNFPLHEAFIFSLIVAVLTGISIIDYNTFEIPILFIAMGIIFAIFGVVFDVITLYAALWGVFVGAVLPMIIVGMLWLVTKRQGMGYGDIQLGIVLGAWLGPMRMALTLFVASLMSLLAWILVSLLRGFDRDRAMPFGPFLSFAGTGIYIGSFYYPEFFYLLILR